jgi:hypothetical protein
MEIIINPLTDVNEFAFVIARYILRDMNRESSKHTTKHTDELERLMKDIKHSDYVGRAKMCIEAYEQLSECDGTNGYCTIEMSVLLDHVADLMYNISRLRNINEYSYVFAELQTIYMTLLNYLCNDNVQDVLIISGLYYICKKMDTGRHYELLGAYTLNLCNRSIMFKNNEMDLLSYLIFRVFLLIDVNKSMINAMFNILRCVPINQSGGKIYMMYASYILSSGYKISTKNFDYLLNSLFTLVESHIINRTFTGITSKKLYELYDPMLRNIYKYYIIIIKLLANYGYNNIRERQGRYINICQNISMFLIRDYVYGVNNRAYKIYKLLAMTPRETLMPHDNAFMSVMEQFVYAPGGQGALGAAKDFHGRLSADV